MRINLAKIAYEAAADHKKQYYESRGEVEEAARQNTRFENLAPYAQIAWIHGIGEAIKASRADHTVDLEKEKALVVEMLEKSILMRQLIQRMEAIQQFLQTLAAVTFYKFFEVSELDETQINAVVKALDNNNLFISSSLVVYYCNGFGHTFSIDTKEDAEEALKYFVGCMKGGEA